MAEKLSVQGRRHIDSIILKDATGVPLTYEILLYGDVVISPGGYEPHILEDENGDFYDHAPMKGKARPTTLAITAKQRGLPGIAANLSLADFAFNEGDYADAPWVSTASEGATAAHTLKTFTATIITSGDGSTICTSTYARCRFEPPPKQTHALEGTTFDCTIVSLDPHGTHVYAAS